MLSFIGQQYSSFPFFMLQGAVKAYAYLSYSEKIRHVISGIARLSEIEQSFQLHLNVYKYTEHS